MRKIKIDFSKTKIISLAIILLVFLFLENISFSRAEDCDLLEGDDKKKCEKLEEKAKAYEKLIKLKNQQQDTLQEQLASIDQQQAVTNSQINQVAGQVLSLEEQINNLERDIKEKEKSAEYNKKVLAGLIQSYYEYEQGGVLNVVLLGKNFSDILNHNDYVNQSGVRVQEILAEIEEAKSTMLKGQEELKGKKEEIDSAKKELEDKKDDLLYVENQKNNLLTQTQGDEAKYQQLLAKVESQKNELFNFGDASNVGEVSASVGDYKRPDKKYWNTSAYYSQKDSRWGNREIGVSNLKMKDYGCAITSVAMIYRMNGRSYDPRDVLKNANFTKSGLIYWPSGFKNSGHGGIKWSTVEEEIKDGNPVIVFIGKSGTTNGHYVVIHNKDKKGYIVHDPFFGDNIYLDTSRALVGKLGNNTGTYMDQMITF